MTNALTYKLLGGPLQKISRSYWAIRLKNDVWMCEARIADIDVRLGKERFYDWSKDVVDTDLVEQIEELWLLCPPNKVSPLGNTARLPITQPRTAFQFKVGSASSNLAETHRQVEAQIIGRVINSDGDCECFVWDDFYQCMTELWKTNVDRMGTWRSGLPPRGQLSHEALGLKF